MRPFQHVEMFRPNRSVFNLSSFKVQDADMGILYPIFCRKMVPGDKFKISIESFVRMNPSIAPIMHEMNIFYHFFFCPLRVMWPKPVIEEDGEEEDGSWEDFMTGGRDGLLEPTKPKWKPTTQQQVETGTYWDYFGFPVGVIPEGAYPDVWPLRALNWVYNDYYRDQTYMAEVDLDDETIKYRCWEKDYFSSALPWQQRGQAPALPVTGSVNFEGNIGLADSNRILKFAHLVGTNPTINVAGGSTGEDIFLRDWFNKNSLDVATFDVSDLRLAFQTQKFLERNSRAGARYTEFLRAHYGVAPRDDRLQRPEYIGGARHPIIVSEVLQTSSSDTTSPQGNLAGHGMALDSQRVGTYYAQEFGICIGIMSIMPRPVYQQGIDREWLGETRYDELLPEFVNLSEQPVYNAEIYATNEEVENRGVFGFNGRFDEYRVARNMVVGKMRSQAQQNLAYWHIARNFESRPALNREFLECRPRKDWLAVPSEPAFIITCGCNVRAVRPLPIVGTPGLIDHR